MLTHNLLLASIPIAQMRGFWIENFGIGDIVQPLYLLPGFHVVFLVVWKITSAMHLEWSGRKGFHATAILPPRFTIADRPPTGTTTATIIKQTYNKLVSLSPFRKKVVADIWPSLAS